VQSEVAERVVDALRVKLLPEQKARLAKSPTKHPEAYALYLQGRYLQSRLTEQALTNSIELFQQAINLQPDFAAAYAGMSDSYRGLTPAYRPPLEVMPEAKRLARRAVELDSTLSEPHVSLGVIHLFFDWDWAGAESEFTTALRLNPNSASAHRAYALLLTVRKRPADALREMDKAQQLDPISLDVRADREMLLFFNGRYADVPAHARKTIQLNPEAPWSYASLGLALAQLGEVDEAVQAARKAYELDKSWATAAALATVYAIAGKEPEARKLLGELSRLADQRYVCAYEIAAPYSILNDKDEALRWLRRGLAERCDCLVFPNVEPFFENIRRDPRFVELLQTVGVPE
jgi:tetratricopeptide (TPR) repeat protein